MTGRPTLRVNPFGSTSGRPGRGPIAFQLIGRAKRSGIGKDRPREGSRAVGELVLFDAEGAQDAEVEVGHAGFPLAPVGAVPKTQGGAASDERGQVGWVVGGAGAAAVEDDGVVEQCALAVFAIVELLEKMGKLATEEQVVPGEIQLARLVAGVGQVVVCG